MNRSILIVEDDPDAAMLLKITMEEPNERQIKYTVVHQDDGSQALEYIHGQIDHSEKIDLILLDHYLPGMYGMEIARTLWGNEKTKGIPIIMVTVLPSNDVKEEQEELGNIKYHFRKPANLDLVRKKVDELLSI